MPINWDKWIDQWYVEDEHVAVLYFGEDPDLLEGELTKLEDGLGPKGKKAADGARAAINSLLRHLKRARTSGKLPPDTTKGPLDEAVNCLAEATGHPPPEELFRFVKVAPSSARGEALLAEIPYKMLSGVARVLGVMWDGEWTTNLDVQILLEGQDANMGPVKVQKVRDYMVEKGWIDQGKNNQRWRIHPDWIDRIHEIGFRQYRNDTDAVSD